MSERTHTPAERALDDYRNEVRALPSDRRDLVDIERRFQQLLNDRGRELMAEAIEAADTQAPDVEIGGERWGSRRVTRGEYFTVFGRVEVSRSTYQRPGGGRVSVPVELRLGIIEGSYTPRMARILSLSSAMMTDEEAERFLAEVGTAAVSKSTIHRVPRAMGARHELYRAVIDGHVREQDQIPCETVTIQVGLDGVMVPQDGEHAKPRGRKTDTPEPPRHERRYGPIGDGCPAESDGHEGRAWHEASVGTIAFLDAEGRRLKTTYLARMPEPFKATLVATLEQEVHAVLHERPTLNVVFASDGAQHHWAALNGIRDRLPSNHCGDVMFLADAFHVAEYVQAAANAVEGLDTPAARTQAATWRETLKEPGGPTTVLRSMRGKKSNLASASQRSELQKAVNYIATQHGARRMEYATALTKNYPIGTGITEAAAKTVVGVRMKRAGARFEQHGGQTIMLFRTAVLSDRFEALHRELASTYAKSVKEAA